jgi:hypothetical protein
MICEGKSNKLNHVSLALSPLMFSTKFIDYSLKRVFQKDMIPIIPLSGVDSKLFEEAKEIGLEKQIPKLEKLFMIDSNELPMFSSKDIDLAIKTKKSVTVTIGPNNVHDILDSLE